MVGRIMHAAQRKCVSKKRDTRRKKCEFFGAVKQPVFMMIRALEEGNGCSVASDWWNKACHVLSIHYLKKKKKETLRPKSVWKKLFSSECFCSQRARLLKRKKNLHIFNPTERGGGRKIIILSVIEVYNVQSSSTLPPHHYFIRGDVTLSTTSDT